LNKFYFNPRRKRRDAVKEAEKTRLNKIKNEARSNKVQQRKGFN
jgi:hypothetical protein